LIKNTLLTCNNYDCALNKLSDETIIGPGYLALVGTQEYDGVVITRDRFGVAHLDSLSEDRWFVLQTNEDHWTGDGTSRYFTAVERMNKIGR